ncbi:MAG TPA: DUF1700 domain-containing protein [Firmicutes bacterium]|nr:DUF1700 domain-containing protein [Bacillota bacterium]
MTDHKKAYLRRVGRALRLPDRRRREILRDLEEAFCSAQEHGEDVREVIGRLGPPETFAAAVAGRTEDRPRGRAGRPAAWLLGFGLPAAACFLLAQGIRRAAVPPGVIGYAEMRTEIAVTGGFAPDVPVLLNGLGLLLAVGALAAGIAALCRRWKRKERQRAERN